MILLNAFDLNSPIARLKKSKINCCNEIHTISWFVFIRRNAESSRKIKKNNEWNE